MASAGQLFAFGLVADVQYAQLDDGSTEGRVQRYREAPGKLEAAVAHWWSRRQELSFILNLGDIINGNKRNPEQNEPDLERIAAIFDRMAPEVPVLHALGNHCLSVERQKVLARLGLGASYYSRQLPAGWRLVVLDTTEMSGHSNLPPDSEAVREAAAFRAAHPLSEENPHMSDWNGGISSAQHQWLREQLREAAAAGEKVIVAAHHQAGPGAARSTHLAWNWKDIRAVLVGSGVVRMYLAGHDHLGGHRYDAGIHWLTLEAILEAQSGGNSFAVVHVCEDRIEVEGIGAASRILDLP